MTTAVTTLEQVDAPGLIDLLERAGWTRTAVRDGAYARYAATTPSGPAVRTLIVPLDTTAPDYAELLAEAIEQLRHMASPETGQTWFARLAEQLPGARPAPATISTPGCAEISTTAGSGPLTVAQLRTFLAALPDDDIVVMSKDAEGNRYSPLACAAQMLYVPESTWAGEVHLTPEALALSDDIDQDDWSQDPSAVRAVTLWPTN